MCGSSPRPAGLGARGGLGCGTGEDAPRSARAGGECSLGNGGNCGALAGKGAVLWNRSPATWVVVKLVISADWLLLLIAPCISKQPWMFPQAVF